MELSGLAPYLLDAVCSDCLAVEGIMGLRGAFGMFSAQTWKLTTVMWYHVDVDSESWTSTSHHHPLPTSNGRLLFCHCTFPIIIWSLRSIAYCPYWDFLESRNELFPSNTSRLANAHNVRESKWASFIIHRSIERVQTSQWQPSVLGLDTSGDQSPQAYSTPRRECSYVVWRTIC